MKKLFNRIRAHIKRRKWNTPSEKWVASNNKATASIEEAQFIYDQAEKKLKEVVIAGDLIVTRTTTLITINTAMLFAIIGFCISRRITICANDHLIYTGMCTAIYLFFILVLLCTNIRGTKYAIIGASPKTLFTNEFFKIDDKDLRRKMFLWAQIENYQDSIDANQKTNARRWKHLNLSIILTACTPVIMIIIFLIVTYLF